MYTAVRCTTTGCKAGSGGANVVYFARGYFLVCLVMFGIGKVNQGFPVQRCVVKGIKLKSLMRSVSAAISCFQGRGLCYVDPLL